MRRFPRLSKLTLVFAAAAAAAGCQREESAVKSGGQPAAPPAIEVKAEPVTAADWTISIPISGSLRSQSMVEVKAEVGGRLAAAHFREGERVGQGQLLAEIDTANYALAHDQALAAVGVAEAVLSRARVLADHARRERERADNLLRSGGITEKDREAAITGIRDAETQVGLAEAQVHQARAAVAVTEKALRDCRIVAPAGGVVQKRYFDPGSLLVPGTPVYMLVDNARLELECVVPSYRLAELRQGQKAAFSTPTWGARVFTGSVSAINPVIEEDNRSIRALVRIANPGGELRSGMFARGEVEVRREPAAIVIPRTALMVERGEAAGESVFAGGVYVVEEGRARRRQVEVAGIQMDRVWIRSGLKAGELIITEVGPALKNEMPVRFAQASSSQGK